MLKIIVPGAESSDNNVGYVLRLKTGARSLTAYRIASILRNNNP